ncbi:sphingomyelin phosphodiesterase 2 [Entomortierella parvispora]|uniref:Sphingomyelin phosphodiesterase 2 n=1 Tax=Entomortierella parvispora TaxID=205924 RepID=A0A9P3LX19_9FUNG|nr:sphingomyelin phosphodiesterase 2 [Entomortierella parvispora]
MSDGTLLSVLTLNCWGLSQFSNDRLGRIKAIGRLLAGPPVDPEHPEQEPRSQYDVVGLQEVWHHSDFLIIQELVQDVLPFAKHWTSGLFGSGLVVLSRYPIQSVSLNRFKLNGDPYWFLHGDWFDGKSCASCVIEHPVVGEIEVFNTHMHAAYDSIGTVDRYLGTRVSQAWEIARMLRTSKALGRHVLAMGDLNSSPSSLAIRLLKRYAGMTDSWDQLHPLPTEDLALLPTPAGLTPEQGQALLGITCDTPLNSWMDPKAAWINELTRDPIGERLDYMFYNQTPESFVCREVNVVFKEGVLGIGRHPQTEPKNVSDHFGVHAVFSIKAMKKGSSHYAAGSQDNSSARGPRNNPTDIAHNTYAAAAAAVSALAKRALPKPSTSATGSSGEPQRHPLDAETLELEELSDLFEQVEVTLAQHLVRAQSRAQTILVIVVPLLVSLAIGLLLGVSGPALWLADRRDDTQWRLFRWAIFGSGLGASFLTFAWVLLFVYGFFHGGETISAFVNVIQEVQVTSAYYRQKLALKADHKKDHVRLSMPRENPAGSGHAGPIRLK